MNSIGDTLRPPDTFVGDALLPGSELAATVDSIAGALSQFKVDAIGICLPNSREHITIILACLKARILACLLSPRLPRKDILSKLDHIGASLVITHRRDLGTLQIHPDRLTESRPCEQALHWDNDALATVIFTSGSSGRPKAAVHRLRQHLASANNVVRRFKLGPGNRWLLTLPLYHVSGLSVVFRCAIARSTIALSEKPLYEALVESKATHVSLVGAQLQKLLESAHRRPVPENLKAIIVGGGPVSAKALETARDHGWPVCTTYGLTEMGSMVTVSDPGRDLETTGTPIHGHAMSVTSEGAILVRGDALFAGYLEAGKLKRPIDSDGWFHTRDSGRLDAKGRLIVTGRLDNMFISGGENISPEVIERALMALSGITDAVVVPKSDATYGARPVAFVKGAIDEAVVLDQLAQVLPKLMIPRLVRWPAETPQAGIKVSRHYFVELARTLDP